MPAAVAVPLITGAAMAGSTIYAANKANKTAKEAAATQTDYGNRALDLQRQMFDTQRADEQPYRQMGYGALNALSGMMGGIGGPSPSTAVSGVLPGGMSSDGRAGNASGPSLALSSLGRAGVMMLAPNGQRKMVPPDQVAHYQQMGAQVVS